MKVFPGAAAIDAAAMRGPSLQYVPVPISGHQALMGFHRHLLDDEVRTKGFLAAIRAVVRPGDVVADLGTGTGILALGCHRAGARRVYAIEANEIVHAARRVAAANGACGSIRFIHADSRCVRLPEPVDVIVSECLGMMGPSEMMAAVQELAERALKPGGRVIPEALRIMIAPVEAPDHHRYVEAWSVEGRFGFDLSAFQAMASNNVYVGSFSSSQLLASPRTVAAVAVGRESASRIERVLRFRPARAGTLHGWCGWFEASLGGGVALSSSPFDPPTIWRQSFLPLQHVIPVDAESDIGVAIRIQSLPTASAAPHFRWTTRVKDRSTGRLLVSLSQSTLGSAPRPHRRRLSPGRAGAA
jgi:precorrin-6B methylase 2